MWLSGGTGEWVWEMNRWAARIGWATAVVAPPLVALWRHLTAAHPVLAAVLFVLYEGALGVVGFAGSIGGELVQRWRSRLVNWADQALGRRFSHFDRRYREFVSS